MTTSSSNSFITNELLTALGIITCIGFSINGSNYASSVSGAYITRYCYSNPNFNNNKSSYYMKQQQQQQQSQTPYDDVSFLSMTFWKPFIPIVISGVLAIYGFIIAILLCIKFTSMSSSTNDDTLVGYKYFAAGCSVGLSCFYSGTAIHDYIADYYYYFDTQYQRNVMDVADTATSTAIGVTTAVTTTSSSLNEPLLLEHQRVKETEITSIPLPEPTLHFCMTLVYLEAIGLYGFIVALVLLFI